MPASAIEQIVPQRPPSSVDIVSVPMYAAAPANLYGNRMRAVWNLPAAFGRFREMGGVLDFATFDDAEGDEKSALAAISMIIPDVDQTKLKLLGFRRIDLGAFYGDWYDADGDALLKFGTITTDPLAET